VIGEWLSTTHNSFCPFSSSSPVEYLAGLGSPDGKQRVTKYPTEIDQRIITRKLDHFVGSAERVVGVAGVLTKVALLRVLDGEEVSAAGVSDLVLL